MRVHSTPGDGFQEATYQRCMVIEMVKENLDFAREFEMPVLYQGVEVGTRRVYFLVSGKISVVLKAVVKLEDVLRP